MDYSTTLPFADSQNSGFRSTFPHTTEANDPTAKFKTRTDGKARQVPSLCGFRIARCCQKLFFHLGYSSLGLSSGYNVGVCNSYASSMFSPFNQSTYLSPYSTAAFGMDMGTSHYETESYGQAALDSLASLKTDTRWVTFTIPFMMSIIRIRHFYVYYTYRPFPFQTLI